ncbi:hypothetical protein [Phenylobacterium sp.]|uniref:hypothetical protein n=1 Tax=Phenylobacterium sp. TaxID=1871053 RepID=UPI00374D9654
MAGQTQRRKRATHEGFLRHRGFLFLKIGTVLCVGVTAAYLFQDQRLPRGGGTLLGYGLGTAGALLIVWLALLGVRKRAVTNGYYSLKAWVSAHVYLGLALIVIGTLHTGFHFGWNVHTLAYGLMMLVITSGAVGVWAYATLPKTLSDNRAEATRKQMLARIRSLDEALLDAAQPLPRIDAEIVRLSLEKTEIAGGYWQRVMQNWDNCANKAAIAQLQPVLAGATGQQAAVLRRVDALMRDKADALAQARKQIHITALLEGWLFVHVPSTFALLAALVAHIVSVFLYW